METLYLTVEEILTLHARLIERFGGEAGIRDPGLVESVLARPRSDYYDSLSQQAAALLQSFALNHPFIDGNKRVAFAAGAIFLRMNGYRLKVDADEAETFLVARIIEGGAELSEITKWLELSMRRSTKTKVRP